MGTAALTVAAAVQHLHDQVDTKASLQTAVQAYNTNPADAIATYGPIADWDVSAITDMSYLFQRLQNFNADISNWDTSSVTNMHGMFRVRSSLLCCPAPNLQPRALPCGPFASLSPATSRLPVRTSPAPYALVLSLGSTRRRSTSR